MYKSKLSGSVQQMQRLETTIRALIQGDTDLVLYGSKGCGKTTFAKKLLNEAFGPKEYIYIRGILIEKRNQFLYLFNYEFFHLLQHFHKKFTDYSQELQQKLEDENTHLTIKNWVKLMNGIGKQHEQFFKKLKRIYILVDNIEQLGISNNFLKSFYYSCKHNLKYFKISFFFCGINTPHVLNFQSPYRDIMSFFLPKIDIEPIIREAISHKLKHFKNQNNKQFDRLLNDIVKWTFETFQMIQSNLSQIKRMAECVADEVNLSIELDGKIYKKQAKREQLKQIIKKIADIGPRSILYEKMLEEKEEKQLEDAFVFNYPRYPKLLMLSLDLANGFYESDDMIRFKDYKKSGKTKRKKMTGEFTFRKNQLGVHHNISRIIAIADILEDQSGTSYLCEQNLENHSLDFYGCIEYLRSEGLIGHYGSNFRTFSGKIYGEVKQKDAKDFMSKLGLNYDQFSDKYAQP